MKINKELAEYIQMRADSLPNSELGGFIIEKEGQLVFIEIEEENTTEANVILKSEEYIKHMMKGEIVALVHSHLADADFAFSMDDKAQMEFSAEHWLLFHVGNKDRTYLLSIWGEDESSSNGIFSRKIPQIIHY